MTLARTWLLVSIALVGWVHGQTIDIDILDASDPGGPSPAGVLVVDIALDIPANRQFIGGGIVGRTDNGAALLYRQGDSNSVFLPPGPSQTFVTFASAGYGRNDVARFAPDGSSDEPTIAVSGSYDGGSTARFYTTEVNAAFFPSPPPLAVGRDGYFLRIALDVANVSIPGGDNLENYRIFPSDQVPSGYLPVLVSEGLNFGVPGVGFVVDAELVGVDLGVYVPEPSGAMLISLPAMLLVRRRTAAARV